MWAGPERLYRGPGAGPGWVATTWEYRWWYYAQADIDIIQLNGSIELAPILGLSDVIVDIVETGTTWCGRTI